MHVGLTLDNFSDEDIHVDMIFREVQPDEKISSYKKCKYLHTYIIIYYYN